MNITSTLRTATTVLTLIASVAAASAVHAAPSGNAPTLVIKYSAARVTDEQGARDLYRRIARAAAQVCPEGSATSPALNSLANQCRADAIDRAVSQVHEQRLVEIAAAHSRRG